MIDDVEYTYLPEGKVIICACDQVYFELFFNKLYTSFNKNISEFNQLHIHLINPDINLINSIKKDNTKSNVSFSWEGEAQISRIKKLKINTSDWEKILPIKIKKMLLAESSRGLRYVQRYVQFLYNQALSLGIPWRFLISKNYIKKSFSKTYYATRRFGLPSILLTKTTHILFIDIDSEFKKDLNISFSEGFSVQAIKRKELSWSNFYAGLVFVRMDEAGKSFIENIYKMINDSLDKNIFYWGIDQSCLDMCYEKNLLDSFDKDYMDFTQDSDASFISYKGDKKWNQVVRKKRFRFIKMSFAKYYLKFHIRFIFNFYRWIIIRTDKKLFALLFNVKSMLIRSSARLSWDKESFIFTDNLFPSFKHRIRHQIPCNDVYEFGIKRRLDNLGESYFLDKINFKDGDIFLDCGANVGDLKLWFDFNSIQIDYRGFEPSPVEFQCLFENVHPSTAHNLALWNKDGEIKFYISSQGADSSAIKPKSYDKTIVVKGARLDGYINTQIKCLKLEAEGAEPEILQGLGKKIRLVEFITADLGYERGVLCESTLAPVTNFLIKNNFELIDVNHNRVSALYKNTLL